METEELTTTTEPEKPDNSLEPEADKEPEAVSDLAVKDTESASLENEQPKTQEMQDFKDIVPEKFLDKDGKVNIKELAKSYKNIEHLIGEKAQWKQEKETLLKKIDNSPKSPKNELYQQAGAYTKFVDEAKDPALVRELLKEFKENPSEELLNRIEENFAPKIIRQAVLEGKNNQETLKKQVLDDCIKNEKQAVQKFVEETFSKHPSHFGNPVFNNLFQEALGVLGTNFDTDVFITLLDEYADSKLFEFLVNLQNSKDNKNAVSEISKIFPANKAKITDNLPPADLLKIEDSELLKKYIRKYSKK